MWGKYSYYKGKRSVWKVTPTPKCEEEERKCKYYIEFTDSNGNSLSVCTSLRADENKKCLIDGKNCTEVFEDCSYGDRDNCQAIKPLNSAKDDFDPLFKCIYDDGCKSTLRNCEDYKKDDVVSCEQLAPKEDERKSVITCNLNEEKCMDNYNECENYNEVVTENKRDEKVCNSITFINNFADHKCVYNKSNKKCETKKGMYRNYKKRCM